MSAYLENSEDPDKMLLHFLEIKKNLKYNTDQFVCTTNYPVHSMSNCLEEIMIQGMNEYLNRV